MLLEILFKIASALCAAVVCTLKITILLPYPPPFPSGKRYLWITLVFKHQRSVGSIYERNLPQLHITSLPDFPAKLPWLSPKQFMFMLFLSVLAHLQLTSP